MLPSIRVPLHGTPDTSKRLDLHLFMRGLRRNNDGFRSPSVKKNRKRTPNRVEKLAKQTFG